MEQEKLIDLISFGHANKQMPAGKRFASQIALVAVGSVRCGAGHEYNEGVKACIKHMIRLLSWQDKVCGIPLSKYLFINTTLDLPYAREVLPNSIVATVLKYQHSLNDRGTGMAEIAIAELINGIETACCRAYRSNFETWDDVEYLDPHEIENLKG